VGRLRWPSSSSWASSARGTDPRKAGGEGEGEKEGKERGACLGKRLGIGAVEITELLLS
jgi:hypothetical protein